jgi:hypothetical protein
MWIGGESHAQRRIPGFVNQPAISPYINLFQGSNAGLNSYFTFVRPRLAMQDFVLRSAERQAFDERMIQRESLQIQRAVEETLGESALTLRPTNRGGLRRPAGAFMNTRQFYPESSSAQLRSYR